MQKRLIVFSRNYVKIIDIKKNRILNLDKYFLRLKDYVLFISLYQSSCMIYIFMITSATTSGNDCFTYPGCRSFLSFQRSRQNVNIEILHVAIK